jgi:hypothetical protein
MLSGYHRTATEAEKGYSAELWLRNDVPER